MNHYRKNGMLDRRYSSSHSLPVKELEFWQKNGNYIVVALLGAFAGVILTKSLYDTSHRPTLTPKASSDATIVKEVEAKEERYCGDAISYIRCSGEDLGKDNQTIMTMIRIARKESNFSAHAKNPKSSASGVFQITAPTWYSNDCVGDKWNFKDNTDCAWKIQTARGFQPWEVWNNGSAK